MANIFVILYPHSEYFGFGAFGGAFTSVENAINYQVEKWSRRKKPITILQRTEKDTTFVVPIYEHQRDQLQELKEQFKCDAEQLAYQGGYIVFETPLDIKRF